MKFREHLLIGLLANALVFWILAKAGFYSTNPLAGFPPNPAFLLTALAVLASILVFSVLPDIDESGSEASKLLRLALLAAALYYAIDFALTKNYWSIAKAGLGALLFLLHLAYARGDFLHRRFPHTFTFGVAACIAAFLLTGSKTVAVAGFVAFASHLIADWHVLTALRQDKKFWLG